jgi:hypothetical protein
MGSQHDFERERRKGTRAAAHRKRLAAMERKWDRLHRAAAHNATKTAAKPDSR